MPTGRVLTQEETMAGDPSDAEARIDALSAMVKSTLTTLVMRGVLTKADIPALVQESETALGEKGRHPAVRSELRSIRDDMPSFLRAALGPEPDPDEDDH
jgi:hypothetical protein